MKGVILAGGLGSRLYPLTHVTNKHLLPVYDRPMIYYPIHTLVSSGVTEIMIVTSGPHVGHFLGVLKNGHEFGVKRLLYAFQEKPDGGIADALSMAEDFADGDSVVVILGDNTTDEDFKEPVQSFDGGALLFLKKVSDPHRFGIVEFNSKDAKTIVGIEEKPKKPKSDFAVTGIYMYDNRVFEYIRKCDPDYSGRGQLEITQVNNFYIEAGKCRWQEIKGFWSDAGTFDSLYRANEYWAVKKRGK